jgi:membrane protein YdbS with pleckstrin-like domain
MDASSSNEYDNNSLLWEDRPSQLTNLPVFILWSWTIIVPLIQYLKTRFTIYQLFPQTIVLKTGILSQSIDNIELYRVRDYSIEKPFLLRFFGLGNIVLITTDKSMGNFMLHAIKEPENVYNQIRNLVESSRKRTGTREVDFQ